MRLCSLLLATTLLGCQIPPVEPPQISSTSLLPLPQPPEEAFRPPAYSTTRAQRLALHQSWVKETIQESRQSQSPAIIIDKTSYMLSLYESGRLVKRFPVELSWSSIEDKQKEGDGRVPEGRYRIEKKLSRPFTRYYRALLINYPNDRDLEEFFFLKSRGRLRPTDTIGSRIEIHGGGSGLAGNAGGMNWTSGCTALSNKQIDYLYARVSVGTPVTIVRLAE